MRDSHSVRSGSILVAMALLSGAPLSAQTTQRVSVDTGGAEGDGNCGLSSISADGRYVAFESGSTNLVAGDTNAANDIFVRDRQTGTTERVSVDSAEAQASSDSYRPVISADGRFVAFYSFATNLVLGDTNAVHDVFVRDRQLGTTERVSVGVGGVQGNSDSILPAISADGRYVVFYSFAGNLVASDSNGVYDVFRRDRQLGITARMSVDNGGTQGNGASVDPDVSADGRYVTFSSSATNLDAGDTNAVDDIFVRDTNMGTTARLSMAPGLAQANGGSGQPTISDDGRYVEFWSTASNLVPGDTNGIRDIFVRDSLAATTERSSVATGGGQANFGGNVGSISPDGRYVGFSSVATNLVAGDTNAQEDIFLRDRQNGTTERVSLGTGGAEGDDDSDWPTVSSGGRFVAFVSWSTNLVAGDTNVKPDDFVRDRVASGFTSLCNPGQSGTIACPCANPPSGTGRGCNNSSGTGGAILMASGTAYLATDTLVFTTSAERPTALSIVTQWLGANPGGAIFGMGVRCTSSTFKRLYTKSAVGGSITAPDFGAGDLPVSVRSAALGDTILAGQSRWHFVYYRDPVVLGGCPAASTFNATQTGQVAWSP
jgi:Tol biopolymer transport system component